MKRVIFSFLILFLLHSSLSSQVKKYLRRAARASENGLLEKSRQQYLKAIALDKNNYQANLGLGITLSEFMGRPDEALPYLENAYAHITKDTLIDLLYALGKSYQHYGRYKEALGFYDKLNGVRAIEEDDKLFQLDLKKRKADCNYGLTHTEYTDPKDWYVVNMGSNINTNMPEYVPVITPDNQLLFTSKRQDDKHEKINDLDGKFFESMYLSKAENGTGRYAVPRRYTVPDLFLKSKFRKHHESIISMSPDGKKLFVYRDSKIYEIDMDNLTKTSPKKLAKSINFDYYQNHAYLSKDNKTLFFTSEAEGGFGGIDIYKAEKKPDNTWGKPINLGKEINTEYDEDAPFITDDGQTLFFASKGHPGFGEFDVYKSNLVDGKWGPAENLGRPINSPAHDIFMVQDGTGGIGYFSSGRVGGKGDMDIYKVNYLKNFSKECVNKHDKNVELLITKLSDTSNTRTFKIGLPDNFKILQYYWKINDQPIDLTLNQMQYTFTASGDYVLEAKIIAYCDTCIEPYVACNTTTLSLKGISTPTPVITKTITPSDLSSYHGKLTNDQLTSLGFDFNPVHFNFNKSDLREDAIKIIAQNIAVLKSHPELKIDINGFADSQGTEGFNKQLSWKRAEQVKAYLIKNGLSHKQIGKTVGLGETQLLNNCADGVDCDAVQNEVNRRVEFTVIKK